MADTEFAVYGEDPSIVCRIYRGEARCILGYPESGLWLASEDLSKARARKNPYAIAWSLGILARLHISLHDVPAAALAAAEAIGVAHRFEQSLAVGQRTRGWALRHLGDTDQGLTLIEEGLRHHATRQMLVSPVTLLRSRPMLLARRHI